MWALPLAAGHAPDVLSSGERARVGRLRGAEDRARLVARRSLLRVLLGRYLDLAPGEVCLHAHAGGKPKLCDGHAGRDLRFSQSTSESLTVVAVAEAREVGVDVERMVPDAVDDQVIARFFSAREARLLRSRPPAERVVGFFACWTLKEAFVKGLGLGFALPLDQFDVDPWGQGESALLATRPDPHEAARWTLRPLAFDPRFRVAVAVAGRPGTVQISLLQHRSPWE